jgi:sugar phosphate isomerase/epimerase
LQALTYVAHGVYPFLNADALKRGADQEVSILRRLAPQAAVLGVTIAMENGDTPLWKKNLLRDNGVPLELLGRYHARLRIGPIVEQIEAVGHPNVGMTLDLAHQHIAATALGFNYLDAVAEAAPYVSHLHLNDNFGKLDMGFHDEADQAPYGEADLHLPPGWGSIPFAEAFRRLANYDGYIIVELKERYREYLVEARQTIVNLVATVAHDSRL